MNYQTEKLYKIIVLNMLMLWIQIFTRSMQAIQVEHHTTDDQFTKMLGEWLLSSPTWSDLAETLRSPLIRHPDIAAEIEDKYIKSDDSSVQESKDIAGE